MPLRLAIFDCDGTLADSEASIVDAVRAAFSAHGRPCPSREEIVSRIGLSLDTFLASVAPGIEREEQEQILDSYRTNFSRLRETRGADPIFPGLEELLRELDARGVLLGVATGKSRRGLDRFLAAHDLEALFATLQTADDAPSKPHPGMIERALDETGTDASNAMMIGDTTFDIEAGVNAGVAAIGVTWGHHPESALAAAGASDVVSDAGALRKILLSE